MSFGCPVMENESVLDCTNMSHGEILRTLKADSTILGLIYLNDDESEYSWCNDSIIDAISDSLNMTINSKDELLMKRLRDFFNVDI